MTTINNIHDPVDLLQNNPDRAETLRNLIPTRELLGLPETFARALQDWQRPPRAFCGWKQARKSSTVAWNSWPEETTCNGLTASSP